jgi:phage N-6-adenine-methyltransferase
MKRDRKTNGDWSTPDWLYGQLDDEFGFTLDAAASPHNTKCAEFFTEEDDGLKQSWAGHTVWCNAPWEPDLLGQFARKAYEESLKGVTTVLLTPYWKGYDWFDRYCVRHGQIRHVVGKVYFDGANGKKAGGDCVVVVFGPDVKGYTNGPSIKKPSNNRQEPVVEAAVVADHFYEVNGEFAEYGPVQALYPLGNGDEAWKCETEYGVKLTIPVSAIVPTTSATDDADTSPEDSVPEATEAALPASRPRRSYTLLSSVEPKPVEWLWPNYIPEGELTIFDGDPGTNKSSLAMDIAARVSTGREMPDGSPGRHGGVVLIQAEDSLTKTVPLRAQAAGADLDRIAVIEEATIPDDLSKIRKTVVDVRAKLLIIDPLMCFVDANANKEQAIRRALTPLRKLADHHNIAIVVVRHLNKSGGSMAIYRGGGSIAISATVRSGFLIGTSPDDEHLRVLAHYKSNLAPKAPSLLFEPVATDSGVRIEWRGECEYSAADLLAKPKDTRPALDTAVKLLLKTLAHGPVEAKEVQQQAVKAGISLRTLERAKAEMNVKAYRKGTGRHRPWIWELPGMGTQGK